MGQDEVREEIKKFLETNENELTTTQICRDTAKAVLRGKFIAIQAYLKKKKRKKHSNKQPNPTPPRTQGTRTKTTQSK